MEMFIPPHIPIKNVSYLRARDPSIIAFNYNIPDVKANLVNELGRKTSTESGFNENRNPEEDVNHLQVYLRIKKCTNFKALYEIEDENTLVCKVPEGAYCIRNVRDGSSVTKKFTFSKIFNPQSKQTDIFNGVVKAKVLHFINGYNCTLLTYGASGSGKTFTIVGTAEAPGIIPRALEYLFRTLPQLPEQPRVKPTSTGEVKRLTEQEMKLEIIARQNLLKLFNSGCDRAQHTRTYRAMQERLSDEPIALIEDDISDVSLGVWVSFAEIYNEYVYDLLQPPPSRGKQKQKLRLGFSNGSAYIKGLTCVSTSSGLEAYHILQYGLQNLKYAATLINDHSSRSHSIFTIKLAQASDTEEGVGISSFNFCDLAGSERLKNTHNVGERLKESNNINTSLLVLGRCISMVRESQKNRDNKLIPFRESKLTQLFQKALQGQEAISMIVNINPSREMFDESQHVLNFSAIAKDVVVEQQQIIQRPNNRFSEYMKERTTNFTGFGGHSNQSEIDEMQQQIVALYNELEQQKLEAQEERENVVSTYKKIIANTNNYWENRCQDLQDFLAKKLQESVEIPQPAKKPKLSVIINLDSSDEEDISENNAKVPKENVNNGPNDIISLKSDLVCLKAQLAKKNEEIEKLKSQNKSHEQTLADAQKLYAELEYDYQKNDVNLRSQILKLQDQITELNNYIEEIHRKWAETHSVDEDN